MELWGKEFDKEEQAGGTPIAGRSANNEAEKTLRKRRYRNVPLFVVRLSIYKTKIVYNLSYLFQQGGMKCGFPKNLLF